MATCVPDYFSKLGVAKQELKGTLKKLENLLSEENGRRLFKSHMEEKELEDSQEYLKVWEEYTRVINSSATFTDKEFLSNVDKLIKYTEDIQDLDCATMTELTTARNKGEKDKLIIVLKQLQIELIKLMQPAYGSFVKFSVDHL